jgi:hypothetical protein
MTDTYLLQGWTEVGNELYKLTAQIRDIQKLETETQVVSGHKFMGIPTLTYGCPRLTR